MKSFIGVLLLAASVSAQTIAISERSVYDPLLASSRNRVLATWLLEEQARGELIDFSGQVIAGPFDFPSTHRASIVSDGERFLVYWSDGANVEGVFVDDNGDFGQPFTILQGATAASATFDGTRYLFFSSDGNAIQVTPLTLEGVAETTFSTPIAAATVGGAASHDGVTALTWVQFVPDRLLQTGVTFITGRKASSPFVLATMYPSVGFGSPFIGCPLVAWNGSDWFVVWESGRSGRSSNIEGIRVTPSGKALDVNAPGDSFRAGGIPIDIQLYTDVYNSPPGLQAIGSQLLVTWAFEISQQTGYVGRYISDSGEMSPRMSLSYGLPDVGLGATTALPNGTVVSLLVHASGDASIHFGRVARRRVSR